MLLEVTFVTCSVTKCKKNTQKEEQPHFNVYLWMVSRFLTIGLSHNFLESMTEGQKMCISS